MPSSSRPARSRQLPLLATLALALSLATTQAQARKEDLNLKSSSALVVDQDTGELLVEKNADVVTPIASLTKLMTALVVVEAKLPMDEIITVTKDDLDVEKYTHSRLRLGTQLKRSEMLLLALMSSENVAALSLSRTYPGGREVFIKQMNLKARALGMKSTRFTDSAGLSSHNVSTARDLLRLVSAADSHEIIRRYTTQPEHNVQARGGPLMFVNSNRMVRNAPDWQIGLQKTGFTNEAGRCLVMRATTLNRRLSMVFLNSFGTLTRFADAGRVRKQIQQQQREQQKPAKAKTLTASTEKATS